MFAADIFTKANLEKFKDWSQQERLIRFTVLFVCVIIVIVQLSECMTKLLQPPIATHSRYELNDTLTLPAVTICREPPYKEEVLKSYGLSSHPKYQNYWRNFHFDSVDVTQMFYEATYGQDVFIQWGIDQGKETLVDIKSHMFFILGQCHTLRPKRPIKNSFKEFGYSILLKYEKNRTLIKDSKVEYGWHVYVHEAKEDFTEIRMRASGRLEYIFANDDEEIEIKLQTQHFSMMADTEKVCESDPLYNSPKRGELCIWEHVTDKTKCTGPWMPDINLPMCNNYSKMTSLITDYGRIYYGEDETPNNKCNIPEPCNSIIYSTYVMSRKEMNTLVPSTQIYIYYTSKLVTIIEERPGYDLSQFVADMGGSLGFLLGLSVLGFIEILERIVASLFCNTKNNDEPSTKSNKSEDSLDGCSVSTVDVADKVTQWNENK